MTANAAASKNEPASGRRKIGGRVLWCRDPSAGDRCLPYEVLRSKAGILDLMGRWPEALELFQGNIALGEAASRADIAGINEHDLGRVLIDMGRYDEALGHLERAKRLLGQTGDEAAATKADATIGIVYWFRGELDRAIAALEPLIPVYERLGDRVALSNILNNLANAVADRGDRPGAERYYQEQIAICRETGHLDGLQRGLGNLGIMRYLAGDYPAALAFYREKLAISERMGNRKSSGIAIGNIGLVYADQGRFDEALEWYERKRAICRALDDRLELAIVTGNIGTVHQRHGEHEAALAKFLETIAQLKALGAKYHLAEFLFRAADAALRLGDQVRAAGLCGEARQVAAEMNQREIGEYAAVVECRIQAAADPAGTRARLEMMLAQAADGTLVALLHHELFRLTGDAGHRRAALEKYRALYAITPFIEHRLAIEELERTT
ncbi:MAG TPA: tetratricopeptide repeat protein [Candidatus Edwardsbacteria bacterium]|nr:tetratricopeptide repeat protein [Candidatus Edwardsbacteria bacterium]